MLESGRHPEVYLTPFCWIIIRYAKEKLWRRWIQRGRRKFTRTSCQSDKALLGWWFPRYIPRILSEARTQVWGESCDSVELFQSGKWIMHISTPNVRAARIWEAEAETAAYRRGYGNSTWSWIISVLHACGATVGLAGSCTDTPNKVRENMIPMSCLFLRWNFHPIDAGHGKGIRGAFPRVPGAVQRILGHIRRETGRVYRWVKVSTLIVVRSGCQKQLVHIW